jgi:hypothetical protein
VRVSGCLTSEHEYGKSLQEALARKAAIWHGVQSWVEEAWEKELLTRRCPLPVNSNWYGLDRLDTPPCSQARRAAVLISGALRFQRSESFPFLCDSSPPPPAVQF